MAPSRRSASSTLVARRAVAAPAAVTKLSKNADTKPLFHKGLRNEQTMMVIIG
jgi:hypothetical protein